MMNNEQIVELVRDTLVDAGSTFKQDKKDAYKRAIALETNEKEEFLNSLEMVCKKEYSIQSDGNVILKMPRLFFIATKKS